MIELFCCGFYQSPSGIRVGLLVISVRPNHTVLDSIVCQQAWRLFRGNVQITLLLGRQSAGPLSLASKITSCIGIDALYLLTFQHRMTKWPLWLMWVLYWLLTHIEMASQNKLIYWLHIPKYVLYLQSVFTLCMILFWIHASYSCNQKYHMLYILHISIYFFFRWETCWCVYA